MAIVLIIYKGRVRETLRNISHIVVSVLRFQLPGHRVSLDNPESLKVPYGVALALSVSLYVAAQIRAALLIGTLGGMLLIGLIEFLNALTSMIYGRDVLSDGFPRNRCPKQ